MNAGLHYERPRWKVGVQGKNLTDERYFRSNFPDLFGSSVVLLKLPRSFLVSAGFKFQGGFDYTCPPRGASGLTASPLAELLIITSGPDTPSRHLSAAARGLACSKHCHRRPTRWPCCWPVY